MSEVVDLKGVVKSKQHPCTFYACRKCIPHLGSIVCLIIGTRTTGVGLGQSDCSGRAKAVRNLSDFENIPKLLEFY